MQTHLTRIGVALCAALLISPTACSSIADADEDRPEAARVLLEGNAPAALEVIGSTNFTRFEVDGETTVELHSADTLEVAPPFEQTWQMTGSNVGFYVRVANPDSEVADIRLRVFIDGDLRYDEEAELTDASLAWVYVFRQ